MDIIDDIIDLLYQYSNARYTVDGDCEVFIDGERRLRKKLEKLLTEK